jgi:hypothetical protein
MIVVKTYHIHEAPKNAEREDRQHDDGSLWSLLPRCRWSRGIQHFDDGDVLNLLDLGKLLLLVQFHERGGLYLHVTQ